MYIRTMCTMLLHKHSIQLQCPLSYVDNRAIECFKLKKCFYKKNICQNAPGYTNIYLELIGYILEICGNHFVAATLKYLFGGKTKKSYFIKYEVEMFREMLGRIGLIHTLH